ncbi:MAG: D-alanine--D-alanine ligase A, partial [Actinobacteria bacterium]|nr:D-alanine--D-alanine ligase A [Actinomycetota bacterium]MTA46379.1 D-alanine--D-alanine ligase A [Actinomycetota bacterium]
MSSSKKIRVAIVCGGRSSEHEISCISANGVLSALDQEKFEAILIGITEVTGDWVLLD